MTKTVLLRKNDGLELWMTITETAQHFAVKISERRARVLASLAEAEAYFAHALGLTKAMRAH